MSSQSEFLCYIPNDTKAGYRGDVAGPAHNSFDTLTSRAQAMEEHGWKAADRYRLGPTGHFFRPDHQPAT